MHTIWKESNSKEGTFLYIFQSKEIYLRINYTQWAFFEHLSEGKRDVKCLKVFIQLHTDKIKPPK